MCVAKSGSKGPNMRTKARYFNRRLGKNGLIKCNQRYSDVCDYSTAHRPSFLPRLEMNKRWGNFKAILFKMLKSFIDDVVLSRGRF